MISAEIISAYSPLFKDYTLDFNEVGSTLMYIPKFSKETLILLCKEIIEKFKEEDTILTLKSPMFIVGDIHGNIRDLLRLLAYSGAPEDNSYLFLGDYIDRGEMSIEVITLLFSLKLSFPTTIFLIRGNHEFTEINSKYGFKDQVLEMYDEEVFDAFNEAFMYLPIAATIDERIFVVHGGISPYLNFLEQILEIKRPIASFKDSKIIEDLVWSDPLLSNSLYTPSPRGFGSYFGRGALMIFMQSTGIKTIIRGHQCVPNGFQKHCGDLIYTVFSSSDYTPNIPNRLGIIKVTNGDVKTYSYDQIQKLKRKDAQYKEIEIGKPLVPKCRRMSVISNSITLGTLKRRISTATVAVKQNVVTRSPTTIKPTVRNPRPKIFSVEPKVHGASTATIVKCPTPPPTMMSSLPITPETVFVHQKPFPIVENVNLK